MTSTSWVAKLWDANSGKHMRTLCGHEGELSSAVFSPDGQQVLTSSLDGTARLWDAASGNCLHTLDEGMVNCAVFSPDGQQGATASYDGTAHHWDVCGKCLQTFVSLE
mmetsp:Transcript_107535/g.270418  ORF Transcript_107535/g.270418 Transcript_107535/m.270418 type:complete len:108 (-) Transcript_107535:31-354(-)